MPVERGVDGWYPTSGTTYPYSGQPFLYVPTYLTTAPANTSGQLSGVANVPSNDNCYPSNTSIFVFISGTKTINPYQSSSWYQWASGQVYSGTNANVPVIESTKNQFNGSGNSLYTAIPNQNMAVIQTSGVANVPTSESSWNV